MKSEAAFQKGLGFGRVAESEIAEWLKRRGSTIIPIYEKEIDEGKGPQIFMNGRQLIGPDMLIFRLDPSGNSFQFIEAKRKSVFTWWRKTRKWCTGIDTRHYMDYLSVREHFRIPLWVLFLHESSTPSMTDRKHPSCPETCPTGLFGEEINFLSKHEDHRYKAGGIYGSGGMVYWAVDTLRRFETLRHIRSLAP